MVGLVWLQSEDKSKTSSHAVRGKGPVIEVESDDEDTAEATEESSSEADDTEVGGFELCKRPSDEGTSAAGTAGHVPPADAGREKRQQVHQDPASGRPTSQTPAAHPPEKAKTLLPTSRDLELSQQPPCKYFQTAPCTAMTLNLQVSSIMYPLAANNMI